MSKRSINTRIITAMLCSTMLAFALVGCNQRTNENSKPTATGSEEETSQSKEVTAEATETVEHNALSKFDLNTEPTPSNYVNLADELKNALDQNPEDTDISLAYAEKLLQLGRVPEAKEVLVPIMAGDTPNSQAIYLSAQAEYLAGNYDQSETYYQTLLNDYPDYKTKAEFGLELVYYQTNQYEKAQSLSGEYPSRTGVGDLMRNFGDREPYKVSWEDEEETTIPFLVTDPLPIVQAEINGEMKYFLLDTGASDTYLSKSVADEFGLETIATQTAPYAGGVTVETNYGVLDSMKLNGVTLENVPVNIADIDHLANTVDEEYEISGVIGTGVYKQFLVTMDYINGELILKPRGEHVQAESNAIDVPFIMAELHFMLCRTLVNGKEINMWPDSGLASEESLLLTDGAMEYTGIPLPDMSNASDEGGGGGLGGKDFETGTFTADTYKMGDLPEVKNMKGMAGILPGSGFEEEPNIFLDGIISHNYLKEFKWTIDYDTMTMTFAN